MYHRYYPTNFDFFSTNNTGYHIYFEFGFCSGTNHKNRLRYINYCQNFSKYHLKSKYFKLKNHAISQFFREAFRFVPHNFTKGHHKDLSKPDLE